jgi:hypothetical protein
MHISDWAEWEVEVGGNGLHWCGIGVARPDIQTGNSLRRPESRGRAWYMRVFVCISSLSSISPIPRILRLLMARYDQQVLSLEGLPVQRRRVRG